MDTRISDVLHLGETYFERMASSLGDKARLLEYLPPIVEGREVPKILDVGAGGGEFAHEVASLGYDVTALDVSAEALERMSVRFPELHRLHALANHTHDFGANMFDVIICSSVLHEVYSYGDDVRKPGLDALHEVLNSFYVALKPGGVLLVRDGVCTNNPTAPASLTVHNGDIEGVVAAARHYLKLCPFANGKVDSSIALTLDEVNGVIEGDSRSIMEFAYTYTWGEETFPREAQEKYGILTLEDYARHLEVAGFQVTEAVSYLQPGYAEHLNPVFALQVADEVTSEWFDSNAIWVAVKASS